MLYLTLVRSQLCCGSQVWALQSVTMIKCTERIQRRASKYILGLPFRTDTSYKQTLLLLNVLPLCYWHESLDMVLYFKLIHGIMNIDIQLPPSPNSNGRETTVDHPILTTRPLQPNNAKPRHTRNPLNRSTKFGTSCLKP